MSSGSRSSYSYSSSRPVIEYGSSSSRGSSSYYSSRDDYGSSNTSMSQGSNAARETRYRDAYDERKYMTGTDSKSATVYNHRASVYEPAEPRSGDARSKDYSYSSSSQRKEKKSSRK